MFMLSRRVLGLSFCLAASLFIFSAEPAHAKKSFFEAMFGWMSAEPEGPDPAETLQAPFAYDAAKTGSNNGLTGKQENAVPLKHAHTNEAEIGKWLITAVSDVMSYQVGDNPDIASANEKYFAQSGKRQFQDFVEKNNIAKVIESGRFNIRSFVKENPLLLNSGTANDRFRWLYEVPIMVSYMDSGDFDYKTKDPVNQHIVLTIQVGRFAKTDDENNVFDVLIETWDGKSQKIEKN